MLVDLQQSFAMFFNKYKDEYASEADAFVDFLASRELRSAVQSAQKNRSQQTKPQVSNALKKKRHHSGTPSQEDIKKLEKRAKAKGTTNTIVKPQAQKVEEKPQEPKKDTVESPKEVAQESVATPEKETEVQTAETSNESQAWREELRANVVESLEEAGITQADHFKQYTQEEILDIKWVGKKTIEQMEELGLEFKEA
ncbi:hypothetical protein HZY88_07835 [Aerococcaceae bacterium DSM 111176]|nr:hypothetical protein [Aerococcaceae bacterium DSM 111176]